MSNQPGQRESMARMELVEMDSAGSNADRRSSRNGIFYKPDLTTGTDPQRSSRNGIFYEQDLTSGYRPKYRGEGKSDRKDSRMTRNSMGSINDDPWKVTDVETDSGPSWSELNGKEKAKRVAFGIGKLLAVLALLYFFVCSLDCLSIGFRLASGRAAGDIFREDSFLGNKIVGVMIGILTTVLVQSSSTSTSIIVSMVAAGILTVKLAIPMVMGANIGTSVTNTIVSLAQVGDRAQFRRAFAGATVHDMFNWLTVTTLLIIEYLTDYLYVLTTAVMDSLGLSQGQDTSVEILSVITDPLVDRIAQLDKKTEECWAVNCADADTAKYLKDCSAEWNAGESCDFLFAYFGLSDAISGAILLVASLIALCTCLVLIVKVLQSVMQGQMAFVIKKTLNAKVPYVPWITGYIAIVVGALMTFLVQSSSVFTSALTPLVGLGILTVERVYPLTLGSNIGTTTTALLASLAVEGDKFAPSLQVALCHLFFNISGILIFYPIPFLRLPIPMSKFLGETTAKYRWFAIAYMILMFFVLPGIVMGLSLADPSGVALFVVAGIILPIVAFILIVNYIRTKWPHVLPKFLQSWKWLPLPMRSLEPYDRIFTSFACCKKLSDRSKNAHENRAFHDDDIRISVSQAKGEGLVVNVESHTPHTRHSDGNVNEGYVQ